MATGDPTDQLPSDWDDEGRRAMRALDFTEKAGTAALENAPNVMPFDAAGAAALKAAAPALAHAAGPALAAAKNAVGPALDAAKAAPGSALQAVQHTTTHAAQHVSDAVSGVGHAASGIVGGGIKALKDAATGTINATKDAPIDQAETHAAGAVDKTSNALLNRQQFSEGYPPVDIRHVFQGEITETNGFEQAAGFHHAPNDGLHPNAQVSTVRKARNAQGVDVATAEISKPGATTVYSKNSTMFPDSMSRDDIVKSV